MAKPPILFFRTKRFEARPYQPGDYIAWKTAYESAFAKQNDFDLEKKSPKDLSATAYRKFLRQNERYLRQGSIYQFAVFERKTGRLMGFILFALILRFNVQSARLSYTIFNNYWKHGYGKEVVEGAIRFAFRRLKLHRLEADILPRNHASIALAKSLGFREEGLRRGAIYFDRKWHDHLVFALLAEDVGVKNPRPVIF